VSNLFFTGLDAGCAARTVIRRSHDTRRRAFYASFGEGEFLDGVRTARRSSLFVPLCQAALLVEGCGVMTRAVDWEGLLEWRGFPFESIIWGTRVSRRSSPRWRLTPAGDRSFGYLCSMSLRASMVNGASVSPLTPAAPSSVLVS